MQPDPAEKLNMAAPDLLTLPTRIMMRHMPSTEQFGSLCFAFLENKDENDR